MNKETRKYLSEIGRKGGQKSRRVLTPEQARKMVEAREAKRRQKDVVNATINDVEEATNDANINHQTNN